MFSPCAASSELLFSAETSVNRREQEKFGDRRLDVTFQIV